MTIDTESLLPTPVPAPPQAHLEHAGSRLRAAMEQHELDALVALGPENMFYVSGFASPTLYQGFQCGAAAAAICRDPAQGRVVVEADLVAPVVPSADDLEVRASPIWVHIEDPFGVATGPENPGTTHRADAAGVIAQLAAALTERGIRGRIGADRAQASWPVWEALAQALPEAELVDAGELFYWARSIKSAWEVEQIRAACEVTESAFRHILANFDADSTTEEDLVHLFISGATENPRCTGLRQHMVSIGKNFCPSIFPSRETKPQPGDVIKLDGGAEVGPYGADLCRCFVLGEAPEPLETAHAALRAGHEHLLHSVTPGRAINTVFQEVIQIVRDHGFPDYSRGHFGHGVGLERTLWEFPYVAASTKREFEPGMLLAVETPYFGYGLGAFAIEDMVLVTADGAELLSTMPRELVSL